MSRLAFQIIGFVLALFAAAATGAQLEQQKNSAGGVTVAVTPKAITADAKSWDFSVVLDTHSQDLSDDFAKTTVLVDERGTQYRPVAWEGAAPGGHHRAGVLKFKAAERLPQSLEMRMLRPGESKPRSFRWRLE